MTTTTDSPTAGHGYISDKNRYIAQPKRIGGQVRGIHRMVDEDTYCIDILDHEDQGMMGTVEAR
ncbi:metal-sensing transcriptional repressor [Nesterenkonia salmonea]|uniref:Metal-sensing transcriptional repressor n=1 Tax=Nesterenkonia salmonea TaxID=1804987 RepID=A0A5R9B7A0_9MICC|nr:metal-sensing transcriptional repressor [Nesterenkonia salmonea]